MREVHWSQEAEEDYIKNIDLLLASWSETAAQIFIDKVDELIFSLKRDIVEFKLIGYKNVRIKHVYGPVVLLYHNVGTDIELIRFWDYRQDPEQLDSELNDFFRH